MHGLPNLKISCVYLCVCVRVLVYVTLPMYALNNSAHAHTHTHTHRYIYIYIYIYANYCAIAIYSLDFHSSLQLQECCRSLFRRLRVHGDAN